MQGAELEARSSGFPVWPPMLILGEQILPPGQLFQSCGGALAVTVMGGTASVVVKNRPRSHIGEKLAYKSPSLEPTLFYI